MSREALMTEFYKFNCHWGFFYLGKGKLFMKLKRTLKQRKFIESYIENYGNATKAYMAINPKYDGENAKVLGCRMLTKVNLSNDELMDMMGMTDAYLQEKLDEGLNATKTISVIPLKPKEAQENSTDLQKANSKNIEFVDVNDYSVRHKYLDTALKLKNKYPAEKHEHTGPGGGPIVEYIIEKTYEEEKKEK